MKYLFSLVIVLSCLFAGCTSRVRQTTDAQISFDPIASWFGRGVSGKQVTPIKDETTVTRANSGAFYNGGR
jgi:hypothetical protein